MTTAVVSSFGGISPLNSVTASKIQPASSLAYHIAMAYTGLGDRDAAFRWLDRGYEEGSIANPGDFVLERAFVET